MDIGQACVYTSAHYVNECIYCRLTPQNGYAVRAARHGLNLLAKDTGNSWMAFNMTKALGDSCSGCSVCGALQHVVLEYGVMIQAKAARRSCSHGWKWLACLRRLGAYFSGLKSLTCWSDATAIRQAISTKWEKRTWPRSDVCFCKVG